MNRKVADKKFCNTDPLQSLNTKWTLNEHNCCAYTDLLHMIISWQLSICVTNLRLANLFARTVQTVSRVNLYRSTNTIEGCLLGWRLAFFSDRIYRVISTWAVCVIYGYSCCSSKCGVVWNKLNSQNCRCHNIGGMLPFTKRLLDCTNLTLIKPKEKPKATCWSLSWTEISRSWHINRISVNAFHWRGTKPRF